MKEDYDFGPKSFLAKYHDLGAVASILSDLIKINPNLTQDIIELAMVMAIHAEQKKQEKNLGLYFDMQKLKPTESPKGPNWNNITNDWEGFKK